MRADTLVAAATGSYAANVALGVATATRVIDTSRFRWVHHALYVVHARRSPSSPSLAERAAQPRGPPPRSGARCPLAVIPYVGTHGPPALRGGRRRRALRHALAGARKERPMELLDAIRRRRTTNGPCCPTRSSEEHQRLLMEVAGRAPSQLNSQPWRFVIVEPRETIERDRRHQRRRA